MRELYSTALATVSGILIVAVTLAFALVQSPELFGPEGTAVRRAGVIPHPLAGMEQCVACHGIGKILPYPMRHLGWSEKSCTKCHEPGEG